MQALSHIPSKTVTSGYRSIKDGEVTDTVELMEKVVWKYLDDTKRIAPLLRRSSTLDTCKAIWEFMYAYIQYKLDKRGLEQLHRPA